MDPAVATIVVAVIGAVAAIVTAYLARKQAKLAREVHAGVVNSHETNLRDDMDKMLVGLDRLLEGQRRHDTEIAGIRDDLRLERRERLALASRLDSRTTS